MTSLSSENKHVCQGNQLVHDREFWNGFNNICFCKQIVEKATRRNNKSYCFTVVDKGGETHKIGGQMFRCGKFDI